MAIVTTANFNNSYHSPGFDISVTGLAGYGTVTVERLDLTGEDPDTIVRGADFASVSGNTFAATDYEAPAGKNLAYRATGYSTSATDNFNRTVAAGGLGTSSFGEAWNAYANASGFSVNGSSAVVSMSATALSYAAVIGGAIADVSVRTKMTLNVTPTGTGPIQAGVLARWVDGSNFYLAAIRFTSAGEAQILVQRVMAGAFVTLALVTFATGVTAGSSWWIRLQCVGDLITARGWQDGAAEPTTWHVSVTSTGLTTGKVGIRARVDAGNTNTLPIAMNFDDFSIFGINGSWVLENEGTSSATSNIVAAHPGTAWLKSVGQPALSRRVNVVDFDERARPGRILGEYEVLGRPNKVVLTDTLGGREGEVQFTTFRMGNAWESDCSWKDIEAVLRYGGTLLFQSAGASLTAESDMYFEIKDYRRKRIGVVGGELTHLHTIAFVEVDRPATSQESLTLRNWQSVLDQNFTWQTVLDNYSSWLDVLQRDL